MEDSLTGTLLERRYRVDAPLARGGMSAVYRGLDTRLDRPVAIKVMDSRFTADRTFVERFEREARSAARIHHPNVVAVHDQGVDDKHVYLVMELVDGATLRDLIRERGALQVPLAVSIMEPVLLALAAAHRAGLIHRDVKPENVLIGPNGEVKVADFGLVRAIASAGTTSANIILGTVAYLSPEQVTTGAATSRGDVYSAGVLLYEMLTGTPPYSGDTPISVAYRHVNDDMPAPGTVVPGIPPALDDLVRRATRRDPALRPADGDAFLAELRTVRTSLGIPVLRVPLPAPAHGDRTVPVSATQRAQALDPEATGEVSASVLTAPPDADATQVRAVRTGPPVSGPLGTRAMLRSDLEKAIEPRLPPPPPPLPAPPKPPASPGRRIAMWTVAALLVLAVSGTTTWWFTSGRWTTVPSVRGAASATAVQKLRDAGLSPTVVTRRDNSVKSGMVIDTDPRSGARALRGDHVTIYESLGRPKVPDVAAGTALDKAKQALVDAGLQPKTDDGRREYSDSAPVDTVVRLDPGPGAELDVNQVVTIIQSKGAQPKPVPDVTGKDRDEAFRQLREAGFNPVDASPEFSPDVDGGHVIRTTPQANTTVAPGQDRTVQVVVSNAVTVPSLVGKTLQDAQNRLRDVGLEIDLGPLSARKGHVFAQQPAPDTKVERGSKVTVFAL